MLPLSSLLWSLLVFTVQGKDTNSKSNEFECDLEALWQQHIDFEFGSDANADSTMQTMVDNPYVNHIPVSTGGMGQQHLREFYADLFIPTVANWEFEAISRTVDHRNQRLVDEMIVKFVHAMEIPFMAPNIKPTNKTVEIPVVAIIHFEGCKLKHEHIYWDQASLLKQIGLIQDESLPILGAEQAEKLRHPFQNPSNQLIKNPKPKSEL
mmetsp:Transcript_59862/g.95168  ORF Transcript_59862/g.95168 Transcript_59862/m.95168 type:complete len:209 (-) Transcript_59862:67-693(-)